MDTASTARYRASFFGPFRITVDDQPLGEPSRRNGATLLLKWFLLNPAQRICREDLCSLFWPNRRKESAINNLHVTLHYLRHLLEPELLPGAPSRFIRYNRHNYYWFDLDDLWWTDVLEVQALTGSAEDADRKGKAARAITLYNEVISYYRLSFLPEDIYIDAFAPYRHEHDLAHARSLQRLMELHLRTGQLSCALSYALDVMRIDPYSRDAVKAIVQVHARQGNVTGAVCKLDEFISTLKQDIGITPDNELLALRHHLIASHGPTTLHAPKPTVERRLNRRSGIPSGTSAPRRHAAPGDRRRSLTTRNDRADSAIQLTKFQVQSLLYIIG